MPYDRGDYDPDERHEVFPELEQPPSVTVLGPGYRCPNGALGRHSYSIHPDRVRLFDNDAGSVADFLVYRCSQCNSQAKLKLSTLSNDILRPLWEEP